MERCEKNAMVIAEYLENHDKVSRVFYPGLPSHPQYDIACKQMTSFGGMISFLVDGDLNDCRIFPEQFKNIHVG